MIDLDTFKMVQQVYRLSDERLSNEQQEREWNNGCGYPPKVLFPSVELPATTVEELSNLWIQCRELLLKRIETIELPLLSEGNTSDHISAYQNAKSVYVILAIRHFMDSILYAVHVLGLKLNEPCPCLVLRNGYVDRTSWHQTDVALKEALQRVDDAWEKYRAHPFEDKPTDDMPIYRTIQEWDAWDAITAIMESEASL